MARAPRLNFPDAVCHVTSRGNGRARIVYADEDRQRFLRQLEDNIATHAVRLYAWVLMDSHFHLLVRTPRANLSQFMQRLNTSYALYARYKHGGPGHQFEARFKAKLVEEESYLLAVTRYIHLNPIKTAACRRLGKAERVRRLEGYRWSSYPGYVAKRNAQEFVCYDVLREYGATVAAARRRYRGYVHACVMEDDEPLLEAMRASRYAIGEAAFIEETEQRLGELRTGRVQDKDLALPVVTVAFDTIDRCVAERYGIDPEQLKQHGRRAGIAKAVAVELSCMLTGERARTVALHYGGISSSAVGNIRRKVREGQFDIRSDLDHLLPRIRTAHAESTATALKCKVQAGPRRAVKPADAPACVTAWRITGYGVGGVAEGSADVENVSASRTELALGLGRVAADLPATLAKRRVSPSLPDFGRNDNGPRTASVGRKFLF